MNIHVSGHRHTVLLVLAHHPVHLPPVQTRARRCHHVVPRAVSLDHVILGVCFFGWDVQARGRELGREVRGPSGGRIEHVSARLVGEGLRTTTGVHFGVGGELVGRDEYRECGVAEVLIVWCSACLGEMGCRSGEGTRFGGVELGLLSLCE
jgi:hypothetical protein